MRVLRDIETLRREGRLIQITAAGLQESHPHDVLHMLQMPRTIHRRTKAREGKIMSDIELAPGKRSSTPRIHFDDIAIVPSRRTRDP